MLQPAILLLREGTDTSQGRAQCISNINACLSVSDVVRTTLGPRGMDKLMFDTRRVTISNDGATIMKTLDIVHPAAKTLVDIAKSQDAEVGDGTTSVVVLASEFLREAKAFVEEGVHPQLVIRAFRQSLQLMLRKLNELQVSLADKDRGELRGLLVRCAETTLQSKLVSGQGNFFAQMVVDAVMALEDDLALDMIGMKKVPGGALQESFLVQGVAFKKTFSYAGFEQQKKLFLQPKILLLNLELELKAERENAEINIKDPAQYQAIVDAEWDIIYSKLDKIVKSGANIVLSRLAIGDLATQYFADRGLFCAGRVPEDDLRRMAKATGALLQTSVNNLVPEILGSCGQFEERQVGNERFNLFTDCPHMRTATIVLRGGAEQFIDEAERSLHDAIMIVRRAMKHTSVVAGGGAIEMELSKFLKDESKKIAGKAQLMIAAAARALEVIPRQLADNAGFDSTDILNKLRQAHFQGKTWAGVDINEGGICDTFASYVWEPTIVKRNALDAAIEAACLILSIDETVTNPESEKPPTAEDYPAKGRGLSQQGMAGMMGRGRGIRQIQGRRGR